MRNILSALLLSLFAGLVAGAAEVRWEAEDAAATNLAADGPYRPQTPAEAERLSGGKWLNGSYKESGAFAAYSIAVPAAGRYQLFVRKFWQHGAFRWHFDDGPWYQLKEGKLLDSQEIRPTVPACWVKLGDVTLAAGPHSFRLELVYDRAYAWSRNYALDCFLLTTEPWLGSSGAATEPPPYVPPWQLKTGAGLDEFGIPLEAGQEQFGRCLPRTMSLLAGSTPADRRQLRILFYGQSIVASSNVTQPLVDGLRRRYPHAIIKFENRAIGGYEAPLLCRTAWQDLYPFYADLVVFHDYGGEADGTWEEMIRNLRRFTTAEILTWTDHVDLFPSEAPKREQAALFRRELAAKHGFELAEVRSLWQKYLEIQGLPAKALLLDQIHLSPAGGELLGQMLARHFQISSAASPDWQQRVRTLALDRPQPGLSYDASAWVVQDGGLRSQGSSPLRLEFTGNRVEIVPLSAGPGAGSASVRLDGQAPSSRRDTYAVSRSTLAPGAWWPAVTRVTLGPKPGAETWTMSFRELARDGSACIFELSGSVTGPDGSGRAGEDFVSKSGQIAIKAEDLAVAKVAKILRKDLPPTLSVTWKVSSMSLDRWTAKAQVPPGTSQPETLVQCWEPGPHVLEIVPDGKGPVALKALIVHHPAAGQ